MTRKHLVYWITTGLVAFTFAFGGAMDLARGDDVMKGLADLGYPAYLATLLGVWKLAGAAAVLAPRLPRVKEWAYAGMFFDLTGAAVSHAAAGDAAAKIVTPLVLVGLVVASYALRPASRTLAPLTAPTPVA